jgi:hypothetical protein
MVPLCKYKSYVTPASEDETDIIPGIPSGNGSCGARTKEPLISKLPDIIPLKTNDIINYNYDVG